MAPPHPTTAALDLSSTQQTLQFLSSVLSQRGPTALPYTEDTKWLIRQHLLSLTETHPSLIPQTATFTHNDGRSVNLLQADGTVPMTYQGITYNIPVIIWLMESYPRQPPEVYVNPTRDMVIKRPHEYVDPSGVVRIPYLQDWIYPSSNLVGMVKNLSDCFGKDPPLYSQRRNSNPNPNPNFEAASRTSSSGSFIGQPRREDYPPPPSSYGRTLPASQQTQAKEDPDEVFRRHAIAKIVEMANKDLTSLRNTRETEMDELGNIQQELRRRGWEMDRGLNEMRRELAALEEQLQMVLMKTDVLEGWLRENEAKMLMPGDDNENVDEEMFEVCDMLSKQMLECAGSDLAIEDVVYCLDTAVQYGLIPFEVYLRNVRLLAREQFLSRALGEKVKAAQMQSQVANMAARIQQFVRSG